MSVDDSRVRELLDRVRPADVTHTLGEIIHRERDLADRLGLTEEQRQDFLALCDDARQNGATAKHLLAIALVCNVASARGTVGLAAFAFNGH